ncbi:MULTISPECIES: hypothetical protein [unclassified Methanosarcina]|nr:MULTISPECIES: hypothetical protein [unclassified Methanosarcina]
MDTIELGAEPRQWHIITLAELPMLKMAPFFMLKGVVILKPNNGHVLE